MEKKQEFKAIFIGPGTGFLGTFKLEEGSLFIRDEGLIPGSGTWRATHKNVTNKLKFFKEINLIDHKKGKTDDKVRVYPIDYETFTEDVSWVNTQLSQELESLRNQNSYLFNQLQELNQLIDKAGTENLIRDHIKKSFDYFTKDLKAPFFMKKDDKKK